MTLSPVSKDSFISSFPTCISCISFPCLRALARASGVVLESSGGRGVHFPLVSDLSGKALSFLPSGVMLPAGFLQVFYWGFPGGSAGKEFTCDVGDLGSIPGLGRSPGEGRGSPLQYSGLENSMDYTVHRVAKSGTRLGNFHFHFIRLGKFLSVSNFLRANHGQSPLE